MPTPQPIPEAFHELLARPVLMSLATTLAVVHNGMDDIPNAAPLTVNLDEMSGAWSLSPIIKGFDHRRTPKNFLCQSGTIL
jgi:hypothetical protein